MLSFLIATTVFAQVERPKEFVSLREIDPSIQIDMRYYGEKNFIGRPIAGYKANKCLLTRVAAEALKKVQSDLKVKKLGLLVFDCYRPQKAVDDILVWTKDTFDQKKKAKFYPKVEKGRLVADGYITSKSSHSRGSTVDLTLVPLEPSKESGKKSNEVFCGHKNRKRDPGLDMGTNFDCFDELANTINQDVSYSVLGNRKMLKLLMETHGFSNNEKKWWNFTLTSEPFPDKLFDFDVEQ